MTQRGPLAISVLRRVTLAKYLLQDAQEKIRQARELPSFAAIYALQDAMEVFLLAVSEHVNASVGKNTDFIQYLDKIDERIAPSRLPFRPNLVRMNRVRVSAKHDAIKPDSEELASFILVCTEFARTVTAEVLGSDYNSIALTSLIEREDVRNHLNAAHEFFESKDYKSTLIEARKAFYLTFEADYDLAPLRASPSQNALSMALLSYKIPAYARTPEYLNGIGNLFDNIVMDHAQVDADLVKDGIDTVAFWNIWRLTPQVYRFRGDGSWVFKNELDKLHGEGISSNAAYVLDNLTSILIQRDQKRRAHRLVSYNRWVLYTARANINVFDKADSTSEVVAVIPAAGQALFVSWSTPGLNLDGEYWHFSQDVDGVGYMVGYVRDQDLVRVAPS